MAQGQAKRGIRGRKHRPQKRKTKDGKVPWVESMAELSAANTATNNTELALCTWGNGMNSQSSW